MCGKNLAEKISNFHRKEHFHLFNCLDWRGFLFYSAFMSAGCLFDFEDGLGMGGQLNRDRLLLLLHYEGLLGGWFYCGLMNPFPFETIVSGELKRNDKK